LCSASLPKDASLSLGFLLPFSVQAPLFSKINSLPFQGPRPIGGERVRMILFLAAECKGEF